MFTPSGILFLCFDICGPRVILCRPQHCYLMIFTARRYASAVFALSVCLSVHRSITSRYCIETTGRFKLVLAWRLHSTYPILCYQEIWVSPKVRVLP